MSKAVIFFAQGLEECEGLLCVDLLRRAGVDVTIAAVGGQRTIVSSPGMDAALTAGGAAYTGLPLTIDGNIITGEALGAAIPFALALARVLAGAEASDRVRKAIVYQ